MPKFTPGPGAAVPRPRPAAMPGSTSSEDTSAQEQTSTSSRQMRTLHQQQKDARAANKGVKTRSGAEAGRRRVERPASLTTTEEADDG